MDSAVVVKLTNVPPSVTWMHIKQKFQQQTGQDVEGHRDARDGSAVVLLAAGVETALDARALGLEQTINVKVLEGKERSTSIEALKRQQQLAEQRRLKYLSGGSTSGSNGSGGAGTARSTGKSALMEATTGINPEGNTNGNGKRARGDRNNGRGGNKRARGADGDDDYCIMFDGESYSAKYLRKKCADTLAKYTSGQQLEPADLQFMKSVLSFHPNAEAKLRDLTAIKVDASDKSASTKCFHVIRSDQSSEDISYSKCINNMPRSTEPPKYVLENKQRQHQQQQPPKKQFAKELAKSQQNQQQQQPQEQGQQQEQQPQEQQQQQQEQQEQQQQQEEQQQPMEQQQQQQQQKQSQEPPTQEPEAEDKQQVEVQQKQDEAAETQS